MERGYGPRALTEWMRGPLRDVVADNLLSERARQCGIYSMSGLERLVNAERPFGRQIWGLLNLELWYRTF